ncbi:tRNA (pseudouridine-N1)-methyltransferase [Methanococcoides methylutens]|uniref:tRNA (pseudouridine(54)-N(1))-methyltransferase n=1 Tax=Methanococcoides methylutens TaxID=2226 RepID=A0A099T6K0_METMT|nr:tRNA (pseudouridine(54)-N(1))-methyltransferase TrmY [Methanococcoides methylutens]KGK99778.1 tRNA (pseudouridine-N1)-methyltransferase [Methanococcoides methylutens]
MRDFVIIAHKALTTGDFSLNDMPGAAGRMDILCRCINSSLFLSHDLRRDVQVHLVLLGEPEPGKIVRFDGEHIRYLNPDERSAGSLIKKALQKTAGEWETRSTPGVFIKKGGLDTLLTEFREEGRKFIYLHEDGEDIREVSDLTDDAVFILGDHVGVTEEEEQMINEQGAQTISLGPIPLHADHCIILINNEIDRTMAEKVQ